MRRMVKPRFTDGQAPLVAPRQAVLYGSAMPNGPAFKKYLLPHLERLGMTQEAFAGQFGYSKAAVTGWFKTGKVSKHTVRAMADVLGVAREEIEAVLEDGSLPTAALQGVATLSASPADKYLFATRVHGAVLSAGSGAVHWEHEEIEGSHAFTRAWLQRKRLKIEMCRVLTVEGDSMLPELRNGFVVLIDLSDCDPIKSGKVYALSVDGEQRIKRLFRQIDGSLLIRSDNPDKSHYPDEVVQPEHLERVRIIGRKRWHAGDDD